MAPDIVLKNGRFNLFFGRAFVDNSSENADMTSIPTLIGRNAKVIMAEIGMNEAELARRTGLSTSGVNQILNGESRSPRLENVEKIADALSVPFARLVGHEEPQADPGPSIGELDFLLLLRVIRLVEKLASRIDMTLEDRAATTAHYYASALDDAAEDKIQPAEADLSKYDNVTRLVQPAGSHPPKIGG